MMGHGTRTTVLLGTAVVAAVLVGIALSNAYRLAVSNPTPQDPVPRLGDRVSPTAQSPLPEITLEGFGGEAPVTLTSYRGRPLVINLWATWCAPCVEEMPAFQQVAAAARGEVAFLGVDVADSPERAEAFVARLGITYDLALDPQQEFTKLVGAYGLPTTLLVTPEGTIVYRHTRPLEAAQLRALIAEWLSITL